VCDGDDSELIDGGQGALVVEGDKHKIDFLTLLH
jgi:hypothetical protein